MVRLAPTGSGADGVQQVGLHVRRRLGDRRRRARGQGAHAAPVPAAVGRDISAATGSRRALPDPLAHRRLPGARRSRAARRALAGLPRIRRGGGLLDLRSQAGRYHQTGHRCGRRRSAAVLGRAVDLEPLRALGRIRAGRGVRGRADRAGQGGPGQRPAGHRCAVGTAGSGPAARGRGGCRRAGRGRRAALGRSGHPRAGRSGAAGREPAGGPGPAVRRRPGRPGRVGRASADYWATRSALPWH